jgi:cyclohexanone monooxygenase
MSGPTLKEVTATGLRTGADTYELDALVFATGFDGMTGPVLAIDIRGRSGVPLREAWSEGPRTYLGLGTAGFPNLFFVAGSGSPSVLGNVVVAIEQHVEWIADCVVALRDEGLDLIEATVVAEDEWIETVNTVAEATLYPAANSWYNGANIPGKPRIFMPFAGGFGNYRTICDGVAADSYRGFVRSVSHVAVSA